MLDEHHSGKAAFKFARSIVGNSEGIESLRSVILEEILITGHALLGVAAFAEMLTRFSGCVVSPDAGG